MATTKQDFVRGERKKTHHQRMSLMQTLTSYYGYECACCHKEGAVTIDHIRPVSKGGQTKLSNLQLLCQRCNVEKGDKTIDYRTEEEKEHFSGA